MKLFAFNFDFRYWAAKAGRWVDDAATLYDDQSDNEFDALKHCIDKIRLCLEQAGNEKVEITRYAPLDLEV